MREYMVVFGHCLDVTPNIKDSETREKFFSEVEECGLELYVKADLPLKNINGEPERHCHSRAYFTTNFARFTQLLKRSCTSQCVFIVCVTSRENCSQEWNPIYNTQNEITHRELIPEEREILEIVTGVKGVEYTDN